MKKVFSMTVLSFVLYLALNYNSISVNVSQVSTDINLDTSLDYNESAIYGDNGEYLGKIVLKEDFAINSRSMIHSEVANNRNYNVHFIGTTANVGFGITVNNKNITRAYDAWSNGFGWSISAGKLTYNSKEARLPGSFSLAWKGFPAGSTFRLRAVISGNQLQTHLDIP